MYTSITHIQIRNQHFRQLIIKFSVVWLYSINTPRPNAYTYFPFECPGAHIRDAGSASVARGPVGLVHRSNLDSPLY